MNMRSTVTDYDFTYMSLGCGVQSSALLVLAATGQVPKPELCVFADTGDEPQYVLDYFDILQGYGHENGIAVCKTQKGVLSDDYIKKQRNGERFASLPLFTMNSDGSQGMLRRMCTREYKIEPVEKFVRTWLGYEPRKRIKEKVRCQMGISIDEADRMKPARQRWITNTFPLVELNINRKRCSDIVVTAGLPKPRKSACVICPYHSNDYWRALRDEFPAEFQKAVDFDVEIRDMTVRGRREPAFLHRTMVPLSEADLDPMRDQVDMFGNECEGMCGL